MSDTEAAAHELKLDVALLETRRMQSSLLCLRSSIRTPTPLHIVVDQIVVADFNRILMFVLSTLLPMNGPTDPI